jgi:large subunit ribosomal protein L22
VRINCNKLREVAREQGVTAEQLAEALPRDTDRRKEDDRALAKARNWLSGRDHPRATAEDVRAMAGVLGVAPTRIARFVTTFNYSRSSPRKARLVADLVRGRSVTDADTILRFSTKRASVFVRKALTAATADAENGGASPDRLVISESRVDEGPIIKRFRPKDRGRAHPIQKKTSHIVIGVEEAE